MGNKISLITLLLFFGLTATTVHSAPMCGSLYSKLQEVTAPDVHITVELSNLKNSGKIKVKAKTLEDIQVALRDLGYEVKGAQVKDILQQVASKIRGTKKAPSIEDADQMAIAGRKILELAKADLKPAELKMVTYLIAEAVLLMERIPMSEYKTVSQAPAVFQRDTAVHITNFHKLVESYIDGTSMYTDINNTGNLLKWTEIRNLYSNNSWIIEIKNHDMYHLHYSYGHPYYLAVNLHTSRSINDRRYALISTLWEAVDNFRTGYEEAVANYFKDKNMSAEEGMLFLGSATEAQLAEVEAVVGPYTRLNSLDELAYSSGWRPARTPFGRPNARYGSDIVTQEIEAYINDSLTRMAKPENKKYVNYHREGPGKSAPTDSNQIP